MQALGNAGDLVSDLVILCCDLGGLRAILGGVLGGLRPSWVVLGWFLGGLSAILGGVLGGLSAILGGVLHGGPRSYLFHRNLGQRNDGAEFFPLN